jgi:hypothetical protein
MWAALSAQSTPAITLHLAGAADALRTRARQPLTAAEQAALDGALEPARAAPGPTDAEQAWAQGRDASIRDTMALALVILAAEAQAGTG